MFKAIKDNKSIALNDSGIFLCLVYDRIEEDAEHTISDYTEHNGTFVLKTELPAPTKEEQAAKRANMYKTRIDAITMHIQRLKDADEPDTEKIAALILERDKRVEEIKQHYPYPV